MQLSDDATVKSWLEQLLGDLLHPLTIHNVRFLRDLVNEASTGKGVEGVMPVGNLMLVVQVRRLEDKTETPSVLYRQLDYDP